MRVKTKEQILKANLAKTLGRIKTKVADSEELWLEFYQDLISALLQEKGDATVEKKEEQVRLAARLANVALDEYENRWGKG